MVGETVRVKSIFCLIDNAGCCRRKDNGHFLPAQLLDNNLSLANLPGRKQQANVIQAIKIMFLTQREVRKASGM